MLIILVTSLLVYDEKSVTGTFLGTLYGLGVFTLVIIVAMLVPLANLNDMVNLYPPTHMPRP